MTTAFNAVVFAAVGWVTAVHVTTSTVDYWAVPPVASQRIPNSAGLPAKLPDGSEYAVAQVLGDGRYLVVREHDTVAPSVYDQRAGTVAAVAAPEWFEGLTRASVLMARMVGDRVVWLVEGWRQNHLAREVWSVSLRGGAPVRLTSRRTRWRPVRGARAFQSSDDPGLRTLERRFGRRRGTRAWHPASCVTSQPNDRPVPISHA